VKKSTVGRGAVAVCAAGLLLAGAWAQRGTGAGAGTGTGSGGGGRGSREFDDPVPAAIPSSSADIARAKSTREQNVKDATRLAELSEKVRRDLEASSSFTLSVATVQEVDEINKLSKKLYARLRSSGASPDAGQSGFDATHQGPGVKSSCEGGPVNSPRSRGDAERTPGSPPRHRGKPKRSSRLPGRLTIEGGLKHLAVSDSQSL